MDLERQLPPPPTPEPPAGTPAPTLQATASADMAHGPRPEVDPGLLQAFDLEDRFDGRRVTELIKEELGTQGRLLFLTVGGSQAYGTATPTSDVDYRGVFAYGKANTLGLAPLLEGINQSKPDDLHVDNLRRMINHAIVGKFGIAEPLYAPKECILYKDPLMDRVLENRQALLSKRWFQGILDYYGGQVKSLADRGTGKKLGRMRAEYTRGPEDRPDEQYDAKFALHAIRLANVALDLARHGEVAVRRPEAPFLLAVRSGEAFKTRSELTAYLTDLERQVAVAMEGCSLRDEADVALWTRIHRDIEEVA